MKTTLKRFLLGALAVVGLATAGLTLTAFRHSHDPARFDRMITNRLDDLLDDVNATDAQRTQITAIKDKVVADGKALHADHAGTHQQLLALWQADQPDAAKVHAIVDGRADAMKKFADEVADAMIQVHGILTPEQRAKITKKLQRHMGE
jgi:Spy/CpxP family protein refolding chaperone